MEFLTLEILPLEFLPLVYPPWEILPSKILENVSVAKEHLLLASHLKLSPLP